MARLGPLAERLNDLSRLDRRSAALPDELSEQHLRPVQHRVLRRVEQRLTATGSSSTPMA